MPHASRCCGAPCFDPEISLDQKKGRRCTIQRMFQHKGGVCNCEKKFCSLACLQNHQKTCKPGQKWPRETPAMDVACDTPVEVAYHAI